MIALLMSALAGLCGALFGLSYKFKERRGLATEPLLLLFGILLTVLSAALLAVFRQPLFSVAAVWLGALFGVAMYSAVRVFYLLIAQAKLNITWLILQFSIIIPFLLSTLYYRERLELGGAFGVGLMLLSILFFGLSKRAPNTPASLPDRRSIVLLGLSTLLTGAAISVPRVYAALEPAGGSFTLLLYQGLTVTTLAAIVAALRRRTRQSRHRRPGMAPIAIYMSLTNSLSAAFLVMAVKGLPGAIVYPVRSVANVLVVFLLSFLFFKERVRPFEALGSAVALAGIVMVATTLG
jgi:drug/metabolite transporter (DMT)-like permease